jgi:UDPglucose 6-dehydrogenase
LSFTPNTDDMREASSRVLMEALWKAGASVKAFDPEAMEETSRIYGERDNLALVDSAEEAVDAADALIVMTEWNVFRSPDFQKLKGALKEPVIFDGRNLYNPDAIKEAGFIYYSIGRRPVQ